MALAAARAKQDAMIHEPLMPVQNRMTGRHAGAALALLAITSLGACDATRGTPEGLGGFRDQTALIGATTRFDPERFAGRYVLVAAVAKDAAVPARSMTYVWQPPTDRFEVRTEDAAAPVTEPQSFDVVGPGRLKPVQASRNQAEVWVLWTDADYRTIVLGTPSGAFGEIWDRSAAPSADRIKAAREILDFNGYDLSTLRNVE